MADNEYEKQANDFLEKTGTQFKVEFLRHAKYFDDDKEPRDIYRITLTRKTRSYSFEFGQSIAHSGRFIAIGMNGKKLCNTRNEAVREHGEVKKNKDFEEPSAYDVLAALTKSNPGEFKDFCADYGYDIDSMKAHALYLRVVDDFLNLEKLFTDEELEQLAEVN